MDPSQNSWGPLTATSQGSNYKSPEPASTSPARDRIASAEQWLSDLHSIVDGLEKRLDTILTPVPPSGVGNSVGPTPTQPKSHVVGRLDILCDGFSHLASRIQQLGTRIEL